MMGLYGNKGQQTEDRNQMIGEKYFFCFLFSVFCFLFSVCCPLSCVSCFAQDPKEQESLFVAKRAFDDGFYDVSLELLGRFLKNYPGSKQTAEANLYIGECYFHQNKFLEALSKFEGLLNDPLAEDLQDALFYWMAEVHFKGNNFSKAAEYYQKVIDGFPCSSYRGVSLYSLGWCLFKAGAFSEALKAFQTAADRFPEQPFSEDVGFKIMECLYNLKKYSDLRNKAKSYLKIHSKETAKADEKGSYAYFYLAEAEFYSDNFSAASENYFLAVSNAKDEKIKALSKLGLGWANLKLKQYKEAEKNLFEADPDKLEHDSRDSLLLARAVLKQETKSFAAAKGIYKELTNISSDGLILIQAYLGEADAAYNLGDYKEAIGVYNEALTKAAAFRRDTGEREGSIYHDMLDKLYYGLAWAYLKDGQFKEAIEEFRKIAKMSDDKTVKVSALCQVGDAYQDSGDFNKAIETYDSILKNYPDTFYSDYVQYQSGLALLRTGNYDAAILAFKTLALNFLDSKLLDDTAYALGLAYFQKEDYDSSRQILENFSKNFKDSPMNPQAMYLLGTNLYNLGKFQEAVEAFKNVLRLYSRDNALSQKCEYEIADCFYRMGNEKEAMSRFKTLRSKYPDSQLAPEVIWWLGEYHYRHNEQLLARRYFLSLIQDFPKSSLVADAYYALGASFSEESKYEEAIRNFEKVIELGKSDYAGTSAIAIAGIYLKQEKPDLALKKYNEALAMYQNLAHLIYPNIGDVYYRMGNYDEAVKFYNKTIELAPVKQIGDIQFKIAQARQAQGRLKDAIEEYLKVAYLYPGNSDLAVKSLLRVAAIYEDKEDFKEALNIYKKIALMDAQEAKYAQERIEWIQNMK